MFAVLRATSLKLCSGLGLVFLACTVSAGTPATPSDKQNPAITLDQGKQWATDEAVRQGMESIRQTLMASQERIKNEQLNAQDYQRLADVIDKNLADIVKNRKVSKESEKAFHLVVMIDMKHNLELMRTATTVKLQRVGALGALQSLRLYGSYFQHPGWV